MNGKSSIESRGNSSPSIVSRGYSMLRVILSTVRRFSIKLHGFSVLSLPAEVVVDLTQEDTCTVLRRKPEKYLDREGIPVIDGKATLFKRVSADFKTQEGTQNETLWLVGSTVTHPNWQPETDECGAGKFHACSRPYFADEFRTIRGDRYIAIEVDVADLYEWPTPQYPHKIAFRSGRVVAEVDRLGK